jgi:predicted transcriptional regulator YdeE
MERNTAAPFQQHVRDGGYEIHVWNDETPESREHYVMVGVACDNIDDIPPELVVKVLPEGQYAVFTLRGAEITSDWETPIYKEHLSNAGLEPAADFVVEYYDDRFKGLEGDDLAASALDIIVPTRQKST